MAVPGARLIYMSIPANRGEKDESFEERRYIDYLHAYQTTGRPPPPCPPLPVDAQQRAALGLPPLFEPLVEVEALPNGIGPASTPTPPAASPPNLLAQAFSPTKMQEYGSDTYLQCISAQEEYKRYTPEELRWEAYRQNKKYADVPPPPQRPHLLPPAPIITQAPPDSLQSINSMPPYDQHSFEELRLAFVRAGRPLTSPEIVAQNSVLRMTA